LAAALGQRADEIQETFGSTPFDPVPFSYLHPSPESPAATAPELALLLHWNRHSESLEAAYRKDTGPQLDAYDRIARTGRDYRHVVYGTPGLKPFKSDEIHSVLLQLIMALQIEPLTADERAACFEAYCPCGRRKGHDADALKKQDARLRKKLIASSSDSAP
jgi:hypothetical protein